MLEDERRDQEATDQTQNHEPIVTQVVEGETMDQTQDGGSPPLPIQQQQQAMHESSLVAEIQEGKWRGSVNYILHGKLFVKDFIY